MNHMKEVASFPWGTLYARRTEQGGIEYWTDDVGGGQRILDTTTVDLRFIKFIAGNHKDIDRVIDALPDVSGG